MARSITDDKLDNVIAGVAEKLKDSGFLRRGSVLRVVGGANCGLIEFQRSQHSSPGNLNFTINVGVVCGSLLAGTGLEVGKSKMIDAHVRQRLGMFLPERSDKWWEINTQTVDEVLIAELSGLLLAKAVPFICGLLDTAAIVALWQSGQCPGLTDGQRLRFLSRLTQPQVKCN